MMFSAADFEDIRPYNDDEINAALKRIAANPLFSKISSAYFPEADPVHLAAKISTLRSSFEFQKHFVYPLVKTILSTTSEGFTSSGFERLDPNESYLFVANHRDIVLDSALLQMVLFERDYTPMEITFGSNLMKGEFVIDIGKVNRMFRLERGGNKEELLRNSRITSAYIRHTVTEKKLSVWIAQRPGRTKDGNDRTEAGLLKMFTISSRSGLADSLRELRIVPVAISYEYEPCCASKIRELTVTARTGSYVKQPGEDLQSIIDGLTRPKGRIHLAVADPVNTFIGDTDNEEKFNRKLSILAELMDRRFYAGYRLWPNNYIAYDMLHGSGTYGEHYTPGEKEIFMSYMESETRKIEGDRDEISRAILCIYANPVMNRKRIET